MGTFFNLQKQWGAEQATETLGWLPLVSLIVFFIAYSSGLANVPFIILGELFPANYRSVLGPISSSFNLLCTFSVVRFFPAMKEGLGDDWTFFLFMIATLVGIAFIFFLLPETKGKTLEEIESIFSKQSQFQSTSDCKEIEENKKNSSEVHDNLGFVYDAQKIYQENQLAENSDDDFDDDTFPVPVPL